MAETPQKQLEKAYDVSDALAEVGKGVYPYEFLADLQHTDPVLFQEFTTLNEKSAEDESYELGLLAELDNALADYEQAVEDAKPSEAKDWLRECETYGLDDRFIGKLLTYVATSKTPLGAVYSNTELIPLGYSPSLATDKLIVQMIQTNFSEGGIFSRAKLFKAYQEAKPGTEAYRKAKEAADFIYVKSPAFKEVRAESARQKAAAEAARAKAESVSRYTEAYKDTPVEDILADVEVITHELHDMGEDALAVKYSSEAQELKKAYENPYEPEQQSEMAAEIRKMYSNLLIDLDEVRAKNVSSAPADAPAQTVPVAGVTAAEASATDTDSTTVDTGSGKVEAAPSKVEPTISNEVEFLSSLRGDGWKRLATLQDSGDSGKVTVNIPSDKTSPDYLYSRIHHFVGKDESVKELKAPEKYMVTINGREAEWKATDDYKEGTWVDPTTDKRVLVEGGTTTIEWKKKEAPAVAKIEPTADELARKEAEEAKKLADAQAESERVALAKKEAIDSIVNQDGALRQEYLALQARDTVLQSKATPNRLAATFAPKREAARLQTVKADQVKLATDYATFQAKVEAVKPLVRDDALALAFVETVEPNTMARIAALAPDLVRPGSAVVDGTERVDSPVEPTPPTPPSDGAGSPEVMAGDNSSTEGIA